MRQPRALRFVSRLRFLLERFLIGGPKYQLLAVAALIGLLSLIAGTLLYWGDSAELGYGEALWWAFLRLTDPGYLGDDVGAFRRTISTALTVLGYVVFLGALVAIMTQWLHSTMRRLEAGVTPVARKNHILILGWSARSAAVIEDLFQSGRRVKRFLQRRGARNLHIVLLAGEAGAALVNELKSRIGAAWNPRRITLRSGSALRSDHLERVDFGNAAAIVLPAAESFDVDPEQADSRTIKTLLSLSNHPEVADQRALPLAVAEILDARKRSIAERAYAGPIEVVASDEVVGRLIAQNVRNRGVSHVYRELLTHGDGVELFVRDADELAGKRLDRIRPLFPRAIALGVVRREQGDYAPHLCPPPGFVLAPGDRLVFMARHYDDTTLAAGAELAPPVEFEPPAEPAAAEATRRRVLIIGWSHKVPALVGELAGYAGESFELVVVSTRPVAERERALARYELDDHRGGVTLRQVEADPTVASELAALRLASFNNVVLMGVDWLGSGEEADARTIAAYLLMQELLAGESAPPNILVELLDPEDLGLLGNQSDEVIVSPVLLSHMLTQVTLRRELSCVFDELFGPDGAEIALRPGRAYGAGAGPLPFSEIELAAASRGEIALGVWWRAGRLELGPERSQMFELADADEVVVLAPGGRSVMQPQAENSRTTPAPVG